MSVRILVTDGVDPEGLEVLTRVPGFTVDVVPTLAPDALRARIGDYDAIVGRSATRIDAELLRAAPRLRVVGRAGVGVDNVALDVATELGVAVINAPAGNTVAVAELLFGSLLALLRRIPEATRSLHEGRWERSRLMGRELRGRRLALVGLGRIGSAVARRAEAFGMPVVAYDPYVPEERFTALRVERAGSLEALVEGAGVLSVHAPLTDETAGMIGADLLARLPADAIAANLARGGIVDEEALAGALRAGRLAGAVVDAFAREPLPADHPFRGIGNLILTPHIGANTVEAQRDVAVEVCEAVRDALQRGDLARSLNVATGEGIDWAELQPLLELARRAAVLARARFAGPGRQVVSRVSLRAGSGVRGAIEPLTAAAAAGTLEGILDEARLNLINARQRAAARGIQLSALPDAPGFAPHEIEVTVGDGAGEEVVAGIAPPGGAPRLTRIGPFHVDVSPRQTLVVLANRDVPGVIGRVGTMLGERGVNIAEYHQARLAQGGEALAAISVDGTVDEATRQALLGIPEVHHATVVRFRTG